MNHHEYVAGFLGILLGFTLTELIKGIAETFLNWERVKYYYLHSIVVVFVLIVIVLNFFHFFQYFHITKIWTPMLLLRSTFPLIFICFICYILFPSFTANNEVVDFKKHCNKIFPILYFISILLTSMTLIINLFREELPLYSFENRVHLILFCISVIAYFLRIELGYLVSLAIALPLVFYWTMLLSI
jgi:hypothetical protein